MDAVEPSTATPNATNLLHALFSNTPDFLENLLSKETSQDLLSYRYTYHDVFEKYQPQMIRNISQNISSVYLESCQRLTLLHVLAVKQYIDGLVYEFNADKGGHDIYSTCTCLNNKYKLPAAANNADGVPQGTNKFLAPAVAHYKEPFTHFLAECGIDPTKHGAIRFSPAVLSAKLSPCGADQCVTRDELRLYHQFFILCQRIPLHTLAYCDRTCLFYLNFHFLSNCVITHALMELFLSYYPHIVDHVDMFGLNAFLFASSHTHEHWGHHLRVLLWYGVNILHRDINQADIYMYGRKWSILCVFLYSIGVFDIPWKYLACRYQAVTNSCLYFAISQLNFRHSIDPLSRFVDIHAIQRGGHIFAPIGGQETHKDKEETSAGGLSPTGITFTDHCIDNNYTVPMAALTSELGIYQKQHGGDGQSSTNSSQTSSQPHPFPLLYFNKLYNAVSHLQVENVYWLNYNYDYELSLLFCHHRDEISQLCIKASSYQELGRCLPYQMCRGGYNVRHIYHDPHEIGHQHDQQGEQPNGNDNGNNIPVGEQAQELNVPQVDRQDAQPNHQQQHKQNMTTILHQYPIEHLSSCLLAQLLQYGPPIYDCRGQTPLHQAMMMKFSSSALPLLLQYYPITSYDSTMQNILSMFIESYIHSPVELYARFESIQHTIQLLLLSNANFHYIPQYSENRSLASILIDTLSPQRPSLLRIIDECTLLQILHYLRRCRDAPEQLSQIPLDVGVLLDKFTQSSLCGLTTNQQFPPREQDGPGEGDNPIEYYKYKRKPPAVPRPILAFGNESVQPNKNTLWHRVFSYIDNMTCADSQRWLLTHIRLSIAQSWATISSRLKMEEVPSQAEEAQGDGRDNSSSKTARYVNNTTLAYLQSFGYLPLLDALASYKNSGDLFPFQTFTCGDQLQWCVCTTNNGTFVEQQTETWQTNQHHQLDAFKRFISPSRMASVSNEYHARTDLTNERIYHAMGTHPHPHQHPLKQHSSTSQTTDDHHGHEDENKSAVPLPIIPNVFRALVQTYLTWLIPPDMLVLDPLLQRQVPFCVYALRYYLILPFTFHPADSTGHNTQHDPHIGTTTGRTGSLAECLDAWDQQSLPNYITTLLNLLGGCSDAVHINLPFDVDFSSLCELASDAGLAPPAPAEDTLERMQPPRMGATPTSTNATTTSTTGDMADTHTVSESPEAIGKRRRKQWKRIMLQGTQSYYLYIVEYLSMLGQQEDCLRLTTQIVASVMCAQRLHILLHNAHKLNLLPTPATLRRIVLTVNFDNYAQHYFEHNLSSEPNHKGADSRAVKRAMLEHVILPHSAKNNQENQSGLNDLFDGTVDNFQVSFLKLLHYTRDDNDSHHNSAQPLVGIDLSLYHPHVKQELFSWFLQLSRCIDIYSSFSTSSEVYLYQQQSRLEAPQQPESHKANPITQEPQRPALFPGQDMRGLRLPFGTRSSIFNGISPLPGRSQQPQQPPLVEQLSPSVQEWCKHPRYTPAKSKCAHSHAAQQCLPLTQVLQAALAWVMAEENVSSLTRDDSPFSVLIDMIADTRIISHVHTCRSVSDYHRPHGGAQCKTREHDSVQDNHMNHGHSNDDVRPHPAIGSYPYLASLLQSDGESAQYSYEKFQLMTVSFTSIQRQLLTILWKIRIVAQIYHMITNGTNDVNGEGEIVHETVEGQSGQQKDNALLLSYFERISHTLNTHKLESRDIIPPIHTLVRSDFAQPMAASPNIMFYIAYLASHLSEHGNGCLLMKFVHKPSHEHIQTPGETGIPSESPFLRQYSDAIDYVKTLERTITCDCFQAWYITMQLLATTTPCSGADVPSPLTIRAIQPLVALVSHFVPYFIEMMSYIVHQHPSRTQYHHVVDKSLSSWFTTLYTALIPRAAEYIPLTIWICEQIVTAILTQQKNERCAPLIAWIIHFSEWYILCQRFAHDQSTEGKCAFEMLTSFLTTLPYTMLHPLITPDTNSMWVDTIPVFHKWGYDHPLIQSEQDRHVIDHINTQLQHTRGLIQQYFGKTGGLVSSAIGETGSLLTFGWLHWYGFSFLSANNSYQRALLVPFLLHIHEDQHRNEQDEDHENVIISTSPQTHTTHTTPLSEDNHRLFSCSYTTTYKTRVHFILQVLNEFSQSLTQYCDTSDSNKCSEQIAFTSLDQSMFVDNCKGILDTFSLFISSLATLGGAKTGRQTTVTLPSPFHPVYKNAVAIFVALIGIIAQLPQPMFPWLSRIIESPNRTAILTSLGYGLSQYHHHSPRSSGGELNNTDDLDEFESDTVKSLLDHVKQQLTRINPH